jgi:hypothetical protein
MLNASEKREQPYYIMLWKDAQKNFERMVKSENYVTC